MGKERGKVLCHAAGRLYAPPTLSLPLPLPVPGFLQPCFFLFPRFSLVSLPRFFAFSLRLRLVSALILASAGGDVLYTGWVYRGRSENNYGTVKPLHPVGTPGKHRGTVPRGKPTPGYGRFD